MDAGSPRALEDLSSLSALWCHLLAPLSLGAAGVALVGLHWLGHLGALFEVGVHCPISPLPSERNSAGVDGIGLVH